jgi:hypothetical protein
MAEVVVVDLGPTVFTAMGTCSPLTAEHWLANR